MRFNDCPVESKFWAFANDGAESNKKIDANDRPLFFILLSKNKEWLNSFTAEPERQFFAKSGEEHCGVWYCKNRGYNVGAATKDVSVQNQDGVFGVENVAID
jgi:hypothetical protein